MHRTWERVAAKTTTCWKVNAILTVYATVYNDIIIVKPIITYTLYSWRG